MSAAPTGEQWTIRHGTQELTVAQAGGGIRTYTIGGVDVIDGFAEDEPRSAARGGLLQPWPNRLRDGQFTFDGADHQVALTEPSKRNAIHGFALHSTFQLDEHRGSSMRVRAELLAQPGWPWPLILHATYQLDGDGLTATVGATNISDTRVPYGHGVHPYLRPGVPPCDGWTLQVPAGLRLITDDRGIPTGEEPVDGTPFDFRESRPIGDTVLDTAYGDLEPSSDGRVRVVLTDPASGVTLTFWAGPGHPWLMAFTGDTLGDRARQGVGLEPMTCPPNALASGRDLVILEPGDEHSTTWGITPSGIDLG